LPTVPFQLYRRILFYPFLQGNAIFIRVSITCENVT
jgi:hypothetical protein